jgi:hypothetical protein
VILRARDSMSQVAQRAIRSLNDVSKAQEKANEASSRASAPLRQQVSDLEKLVEAHTREKRALEESSRSLRSTATARRAAADASRKQLEELQRQARVERAQATEREKRDIEEIRTLRLAVAERVASGEKKTRAFNRETREMREQAALLEALNRESAAANQRRAAELGVEIAQIQSGVTERNRAATKAEQAAGKQERAFNSVSKSVDRHNNALNSARAALERTEGSFGRTEASASRMGRVFESMRRSTNNARSGLRGLNAEFQGFQIALMIKYAQSLISAMIALGAQLFAVAAAAAQAAVGIGAALAAGAAQAVPVIGVLAAAFSRLTSVLKIVKLQNQQQLTATHDATRAAKAHQTATDQIRSAEQRVADAHRNTTQAVRDLSRTRSDAARQELQDQQAVNQARKDAVRTVEDLKAAEEDAIRSLDSARANRQTAIESGDVAGTVQADVDVTRARRDVRRTRQDAAPVRARGVEGVQAVQQAEQQLADTRRQGARQIEQAEQRLGDARRSERQATDDLSRTRRESADNLAQETAAADKLADSLRQLSPAERELYRRILVLQDTYRRIARPITDIITRAFTGVVDRVNSLLQDPRIVRGFRNIATQIAGSIRTATREAGGPRSVSAFQILSAEAARNIPIATRILVNFFDAARNIVLDAVPAFRRLLGYVEDYSEKAKDASGNSKGISDFFLTGIDYAKSFFDLGLAVVRLFLALAGPGGAASEGNRTIKDLTGVIDDLTEKVRYNSGRIRHFFDQVHDVFFDILRVVGHLASAMAGAFSANSVHTFADFLNRVIIPALSDTVEIMGFMVNAFHQIFSVPIIGQVAHFAADVLLMAYGFTIIRKAISSVMDIIPSFLKAMGLAQEELVGMTAGGEAVTATAVTPFGWVVLGVAAAIAAIVLLDRHFHFLGPTWRWLKNAAKDTFDAIKSAAGSVARWFSDVWTQGLLYWIRYPFVWLAKNVSFPIWRWIINAARDVINWLTRHFGPGGDFAIVGDLLTLPFRTAKAIIKEAFDVIRTIIEGALDLIAGRFDRFGSLMGDFWANFIDVGRGAISSLLGIIGDLMGALGHIPELGKPFKRAANDIHDAQHRIDDLRDSTKKNRQEQKRSDDTVKDSLPNLVKLHDRYKTATDRLDHLTPGTKAFRDATHDARDASRHYNDALKDTADKAGGARQPVGKLRSNIQDLGGVSADTADAVAHNLNAVLSQVGARMIRLNTRAYRHSGVNRMTEVVGHGATGGVLSRAHGLRRRMWGGGMPNPYGGAADDHVLLSPSGAPVAALSGTEGIVNRPQMGVINQALGFTQQMTGMPWGSLNDLWGSGMRHFQGGGGLQPAIRNLSNRLDRMFGLTTTSTTGGGHATNSYHYRGLAADISGSPQAMARATRYIRSSGIWHSLLEGIHNPGLSVKNGQNVPAGFWGANTWADHMDHIHLALSRAARLFDARVQTPRIQGLGTDAISRIARGSAQTLSRAANRYLQRQMAKLGGADPKAMGADANVVRAFRRAISTTGATSKERLALWEGGIVESGLRNLQYGDADSLGSLQERASIYGRAHALDPYASAMRFLRDAISKRPWRGSAGSLAQAVQRSAFPGRYDQVRARAQRYMQTGGPIRGNVGPTTGTLRPFPRAARPVNFVTRSLSPILEQVNASFRDITTTLESTARGPLRRSKNLVRRIGNAFTRITGDNGLLDQMRAQIETITDRGARALQRRQFRVTRQGPRRVAPSPTRRSRKAHCAGCRVNAERSRTSAEPSRTASPAPSAASPSRAGAATPERQCCTSCTAQPAHSTGRQHDRAGPERSGSSRGSGNLPASPAHSRHRRCRSAEQRHRSLVALSQGTRAEARPQRYPWRSSHQHAQPDRRPAERARAGAKDGQQDAGQPGVRPDRRPQRPDPRGGRAAVPELHRRRQHPGATADGTAGSADQDCPARRPDQLRGDAEHPRSARQRAAEPARRPARTPRAGTARG